MNTPDEKDQPARREETREKEPETLTEIIKRDNDRYREQNGGRNHPMIDAFIIERQVRTGRF